MDTVTCAFCQKQFTKKRSQIKLSIKHYCSIACSEKGRRMGKNILCSSCGTEVYRSRKDLNGSKSGEYFCSNPCLLKWIYEKYDGHPNWKGGKYPSYREKLIKNDTQPMCLLCTEGDIRMLAVHHVDKNRLNNVVTNLVWLCHNCHYLIHHYKEEEYKLSKKLYGKKV